MSNFNQKNLMPKIFAIFFALTIWVYVMSEINPRITKDEQNIPVEFLNAEEMLQSGLAIKGETDHTIRVRIVGRRDEVQRITRGQIRATADILGFRPGINNIPVEVTVPGEVEVDWNPRFIRVELEEIISKQKPVNVVIEGAPRRGYTLGELQHEPTVVWVEGAESLVNSVEVVEATIKLSEEFQNINTSYSLRPLNSRKEEVPNVRLQTTHVNVNLPIDQLKTVDINPIVEVTAAEGYEINNISVEPSTVTIRGQQEIVDTVENIDTEAIAINNISENISRRVSLNLPEGIAVVDSTEVNLAITVDSLVEEIFDIARDNINFKNLAPGLRIDTNDIPNELQVRILANETVLEAVNSDNINIIIDMEGLEENQYTVEPVVEVPFLIERRAKEIQLIPKSVNIRVISENS
ncbi:YbbR domain-containing protein [Anaerovirgula multivorans]|uniref:YbbR domain-containing protein n=1 Tax=Anaerovirgula multivorans TaxID=312168 RepID=A0A239JIP3_9FIRM|nr:CdaR family protein [Anaerovirgula multivorans]SNT05669.1 YbbR domain-containing protein [Anaerovirgula multivorans]